MEKSPRPDKAPKIRPRRWLKILGILALVIFLSVAGALFWVRSDAGLNYLADKAAGALTQKGLSLSWSKLEGPVPEKLSASGLIFRDVNGQFASLDRLELDLKIGSVFNGLLEVELLKAEGLKLDRRPVIEPSPKPDDSSGGSLPFDLIAHFDLSGSMTHRFLSPEVISDDSGRLALSGQFSLIDGVMAAQIDTLWLDHLSRGLELTASLSQGLAGNPDQLNLNITARDGPGGPLSYLLNKPDWPSWSLTLNGQGPLSGWEGLANLELDRNSPELSAEASAEASEQAAAPDLSQNNRGSLTSVATVKLNLAGKTGTIRDDFIKNRNLSLTALVQAGPEAPLPIPEDILEKLGQNITLEAKVDLQGESVKGDLKILSPKAKVSLTEIDFSKTDTGFDLTSQGRLTFDPGLLALLKSKEQKADSNQTESINQSPYPSPPPQIDQSATVAAAVATATTISSEASQADQAGSGSAPQELLTFDYNLDFSARSGQMALKALNLTGSGLSLKATGSMEADQAKRAEVKAELDKNSVLWPLILTLVGSRSQKSGAFGLTAKINQDSQGLLDLASEVNLEELALLASPWAGPIKLDLKAQGPVNELKVDLSVQSQNLKGPREDFPQVAATYKGQILGLPNFNGLDGNLTLETGDFSSGPINLATGLSLALPLANNASQTENHGLALDLSLAGLSLSAGQEKELLDLESPALKVSLRPGQVPQLGGSLRLKVGNWQTVQALTGLDINGSPAATLEANLDPAEGTHNSAAVKLDLTELQLGQELKVKNLNLSLEAKNYLTDPDFSLTLAVGPSQLGPISLSGGQIKGQGDGQKANLAVDFNASNGAELLHLVGSGDLKEKKANISSLRLASIPQLPGGLKLIQPMDLDYNSGLSIGQAVIALGRGGTLDLSGDLKPLNVKAKLVDFSYANLSGLTEKVPQGKANLTLDYNQGGSGNFDLTTQLAAPPALESLSKTLNISATGRIENSRSVSGNISLTKTRIRDISLNYRLPLIPEGQFFRPDLNGPLSAEL
ncbi:MAG: hypothetical protein LBS44_07160, partial [Deltaproteobacteria bacterium]|nr:hypothetical protein [Deltaproteobacteria bacterium]